MNKVLYLQKIAEFFDFWKKKNSATIEKYLGGADIDVLRKVVYQDFTGFEEDFEQYYVAMINSISEKKDYMGVEYIKIPYSLIEKEICLIFKSSIQASTGLNFSQKGLFKMLRDNDKNHLIKYISPFLIENACKRYNKLYSKEKNNS